MALNISAALLLRVVIGQAPRLTRRPGFRPAGRLRQSDYWPGEHADELITDALLQGFLDPSAVPTVIDAGTSS